MIDSDWKDIYRKRFTTTEKAIQHIESFQTIFLAPMCNEPQALVDELIRQKARLQGISLYSVVLGSPCKYADIACHPHFSIRTFLSSPLLKKAYENNKCDYLPVNFSEIPRWIKEEHIDVALIQVSPPNADGFCNLGLSVDAVPTLIKEAKIVIAEVNSNLPVTFGETLVHVLDISFFVHSDEPLLTIRNSKPSEEDLEIGRYVATLIPDYATIQVGVGKIAAGIVQSLQSKVGLGVHSGSITDDIMELIKNGVVTNERKEINRDRTVCTTLTGTNDLYEFCHQNERIELYPINYTHNAAVISKISNFYSINSALEVSLSGQINAEQVDDSHVVAGVGGQMDFIRASKLSPGGKAIIALQWDAVIAVHLKGSFNMTRAAAPFFKEQKSGRFIHFTSTSGLIGNVGQANYSAAKLGIVGLSKSTALDMARYNVTSNAIAPFAWSRLIGTIPAETDAEKVRVERLKQLSPAHIAPLVGFLSSDEAADVSGQIFGVRGKEIMVFSQPRPVRSVYNADGWSVDSLSAIKGSLQSSFTPLEVSADVFPYEPLV